MVNQHNNQKLSANEFFKTAESGTLPSPNFKEELRAKVLGNYLSFQDKNHMNEKRSKGFPKALGFFGLGVALAAIVAAVPLFLLNDSKESKDTPTNQKVASNNLGGEVAFTEGDVEFKKANVAFYTDINDSYTLEEGDAIKVAGDGKAIINLDDGSSVRLNADSEVTFASLDPQAIIIENQNGEVYSRVAKLDRSFDVMVDENIVESLGTAYKTTNTTKVKGVEVYQSSVKVNSETEVTEGKKFYFKNETDKKSEKSVKDLSKDEIKKDTFALWNKEQDIKASYEKELGVLSDDYLNKKEEAKTTTKTQTETKNESNDTPADPGASISASATVVADGIKVQWSISGATAPDGYKVVYSHTDSTPKYGENSAQYVSGTSTKLALKDGKTYYIRVCRYTGSGCDTYSNTMTKTAPNVPSNPITGVTLSYTGSGFSWVVNGGPAVALKLLWTTDGSAPSMSNYAGAKIVSGSSIDMSSIGLGSGSYEFKLCAKDDNGTCYYSNQEHVDL